MKVDIKRGRFPAAIVFRPTLSLLAHFIPTIGNVGIGDSRGEVHDFISSNCVIVDDPECELEEPHKYLTLDLGCHTLSELDKAIEDADDLYRNKKYSQFWRNCYSHVATVLNNLGYDNHS